MNRVVHVWSSDCGYRVCGRNLWLVRLRWRFHMTYRCEICEEIL